MPRVDEVNSLVKICAPKIIQEMVSEVNKKSNKLTNADTDLWQIRN